MEKKVRLLDIFLKTLRLSSLTFGGGFVIVSLMQKEFVEKLGWLKNEEMQDITIIAQSAPGPIAVNTAIMLGYRLRGIKGVCMSVLGMILPPLVILSVISVFYTQFKEFTLISAVLQGMRAGVAAIVIDVSLSIIMPVIMDKKPFYIIIMLCSFAAACILKVNIIIILIICLVIGLMKSVFNLIKK